MIAGYVTKTYEISDSYKEIQLKAGDAKVKIEPSDGNKTALVIFEKKRRPYEFFINNGTLAIKPAKARWYNFIRIGIDRSEIKLSIPKAMLERITVSSNVGCVDISSITCRETVDIQVNTGDMSLENVTCRDVSSQGNTGSVSLNNVTAEKSITIKRNTGKVLLNDCFAPDIFVKNNTGKVCGRLPSNTAFVVRSNTGKAELPKAPIGETIGGRCEIKTNTGRIKFE